MRRSLAILRVSFGEVRMSIRFRSALAVVLFVTPAASPLLAESARVAATSVNVRRGPSTGSPVVVTAARGETLEVLERAGDWARVRTRAGVEGYVSVRFLEPVPGASSPGVPAATPPTATPPAAAPIVPAPPAARVERVAIAHNDVGCVVAGAFPRLDACFTPAEAVGRARVLFRADEQGPWYYVDMKPEGACQTAVLPKPTRSISSFGYFIEVVDRSFMTVGKPEAAPSESFTPRVVGRDVECRTGALMAKSQPIASVVVGVARDAGGKVLQAAAAHTVEAGASISGFSTEGITMVSTGAAPSAGSAASTVAKAGGLGTKTLAIVGGVAAAGVVAAVAAGGGGGGSSSTGGSGGPTGSGPSGGTSPGSSSLTGRWVGNAGSGDGLTLVISGEGLTCNYTFDITTDMVHSGSTFTGTGTSVARSFTCSISLPPAVTSVVGTSGSGSFSGTASGGSIATQIGIYNYSGTYTSTRIEMISNLVLEGFNLRSTWRQTKQ